MLSQDRVIRRASAAPIRGLSDDDAPEPESATGQYPGPVWNGEMAGAAALGDFAGEAADDQPPEPPSATGQYPDSVWGENGGAVAAGLGAPAFSAGRADAKLPAAPGRVLRARAMETGTPATASVVAGQPINVVRQLYGNITWELEQLGGFKHPNDIAPSPAPPVRDAPQIRLSDWPYLEDPGQERIYAWLTVDWQFTGKSLGNIRINVLDTRGAVLNGGQQELALEARITDDRNIYPPASPIHAALQIRVIYKFKRASGSICTAAADLRLYGDGTFDKTSRWEQ